MATVERSVTIRAPVEKIFSYISNPTNELEWLPSIIDVRHIVGKGVGQRFGWTYKMMGIPLKGETDIVEYIPNERIVYKTAGGIDSTWTWQFKPEAGGTKLNLAVEYTIPVTVLGRVAEQLVLQRNEREAHMAIANIKERLEG
jgi:uncharacterized membrane protein